MIELREMLPDDWRTWRSLRLAALAEAAHAFGSRLADWERADEARWRARLAVDGIAVVAALDGDPVGMVAAVPDERPGSVELISMWVAPPARGSGVADDLAEHVRRWAVGRGSSAVRLCVMAGNDRARSLYLRHGYRPDRTTEPRRHPDGRVEEVLVLELAADQPDPPAVQEPSSSDARQARRRE